MMVSTITDRVAGSVNGAPVSVTGYGIIQGTSVGGTADNITAVAAPVIPAYASNQYYSLRPVLPNNGAVDLDFGYGFKNLLKPAGGELAAGEFDPALEYLIKYNGTEFRIVAPSF